VSFVNGTRLARLLGCDIDTLNHALTTHGLDADSAMGQDYDLTAARMDMEASPPGVDLRTIAAMHYQAFRDAKPRDWRNTDDDDDDSDNKDKKNPQP
jgi:hypothetical protein